MAIALFSHFRMHLFLLDSQCSSEIVLRQLESGIYSQCILKMQDGRIDFPLIGPDDSDIIAGFRHIRVGIQSRRKMLQGFIGFALLKKVPPQVVVCFGIIRFNLQSFSNMVDALLGLALLCQGASKA